MMTFNKSLIALALVLPATAFASGLTTGTEPSTEVVNQIHAALQAKGLEVQEIELEDGGYEVEAEMDGLVFEVYMDAELNILEMEEEGPEEDGDDD